MKTRIYSIITAALAVALFCTAIGAAGADSAEELAALQYDRAEFESGIHKTYQDLIGDPSKAAQVKEAVDKYLKTAFPWKDLEAACVRAIRAAFTPEEQTQLLAFLRSPVGKKYENLRKTPAFDAVSDLLAREGLKMLHAIEAEIDGRSGDVKPDQQPPVKMPQNVTDAPAQASRQP